MEYMPLLIMGILLMAVSVPNLLGNVRTVHRHNRRRVSQEADDFRTGGVLLDHCRRVCGRTGSDGFCAVQV